MRDARTPPGPPSPSGGALAQAPGGELAARPRASDFREAIHRLVNVVPFEGVLHVTALGAPEAPPEGDLVPNGTGWLVALAAPRRRLHPELSQFVPFGITMGGALLAVAMSRLMPLGLAVPAATACGAALVLLSERLFRREIRRQLEEAAVPPGRLADLPAGTLVRLRGVVAAQPSVTSLFRGLPAVLFRNRLGVADETRGIDFLVDLDDGQKVRVGARGAMLLDEPRPTRWPPVCGPVLVDVSPISEIPHRLRADRPGARRLLSRTGHECSIGPGSRIELCGLLYQEPDPAGAHAFERQVPMLPVLRASPDAPLFVRSLDGQRDGL